MKKIIGGSSFFDQIFLGRKALLIDIRDEVSWALQTLRDPRIGLSLVIAFEILIRYCAAYHRIILRNDYATSRYWFNRLSRHGTEFSS